MKPYQKSIFGQLRNEDIFRFTFENDLGYRLSVMNYGATILEYQTPDKAGHFANVILGFDRFADYIGNSPKHGASIGPVAGRIAGATFDLAGENYILEANNGQNCNHSGSTGWDSVVFQIEEVTDEGLVLYTERRDGTGGFPGNLKAWISYTLSEQGELEISYQVQTDKDTLINPTNHSYFNLSGHFDQPIDDHVFQVDSLGVFPIAKDGIPAKEPEEREFVKHLRQAMLLKDLFAEQDEQVQLVSGLDHPFALKPDHETAGFLYHQESGRFLTFKTEAPCLVVYTANCVDDAILFNGKTMKQHNGIALEMQALPDAIHSNYKDQVLVRAGQEFTSTTTYRVIAK